MATMVTKEDIVFDMCMDTNYSYTYYGKNINGIATVSLEGYDDMIQCGLDTNIYILNCFMLWDREHDNLKNHNDVYKLDIEFTIPGTITPIFKEIG